MKFTEALRLADEMELPDSRGMFVAPYISMWGGEKPPCCAIGGANVAVGHFVFEERDGRLTPESQRTAWDMSHWSELGHRPQLTRCPAGCDTYPRHWDSAAFVMHLYDAHDWSRTQIADFLDTILTE